MPKLNLAEPPYVEDALLRQWILDIHTIVSGLGADSTGTLDDDNLSDVIPNRTDTESITGVWTFDIAPYLVGTISNTFTLDSDDTGGNIDLIFGTTVNKYLRHTGSIFEFNDNLSLTDNNITNVADIRLKTITSDDDTTISVILGTDAGDDFIVGNNNTFVVTGDTERAGFGILEPEAKVDVRTAGNTLFLNLQTSSVGIGYIKTDMTNNGGTLRIGVEDFDGTSLASGTLAYASYVGSETNTALHLGTNSAARVTIDTSGNVGIGTASPTVQLAVWRNSGSANTTALLKVEDFSANGDASIQYRVDDATSWFTGIDTSDGNKFKIGTGVLGNSDKLIIDTSGNSYLGSDASLKFSAGAIISADDGTNDSLVLNAKGTGGVWINYNAGTGSLQIYDGSTTQVAYISTAGVVQGDSDFIIGGDLNHDGSGVGFYGTAPVSKRAHIVDADGTLADITTKFNTLLTQIEQYGLLATS